MKTTTRLLMIFLCACASQSADPGPDAGAQPPPPGLVDPTGTWTMSFAFSADSCGHPAVTIPKTLSVAYQSGKYTASVVGTPTPQYVESGTFACSSARCELNVTIIWASADGTTTYREPCDLFVDAASAITGNGSETNTSSAGSCSASFTATGTKH